MSRDLFIGITEQSKASIHRRDDAHALFHSARFRGAMYMAGYSMECLLKTKLMQKFGCRNLRDLEEELQRRQLLASSATIFTHQLEVLLQLSGGKDRLRQDNKMWQLFNMVNQWIPAWRYNPDGSNRENAEDYLDAIDKVRHWIDNNV